MYEWGTHKDKLPRWINRLAPLTPKFMSQSWKHWLRVLAKTHTVLGQESHPRISCRAYLVGTRSRRIRRSSSSSRVWYNSCEMKYDIIIVLPNNHHKYMFRNLCKYYFRKFEIMKAFVDVEKLKTLSKTSLYLRVWVVYLRYLRRKGVCHVFVSSWGEL